MDGFYAYHGVHVLHASTASACMACNPHMLVCMFCQRMKVIRDRRVIDLRRRAIMMNGRILRLSWCPCLACKHCVSMHGMQSTHACLHVLSENEGYSRQKSDRS